MQIERAAKDSYIKTIGQRLSAEPNILFAYLHGSFVDKPRFNDIDIAVYVADAPASTVKLELRLAKLLEASLESRPRVTVDVRLLNNAPLAFRYRATKDAVLLFSRDERRRVDFEVSSRNLYFDFTPLRDRYLAGVLGRAV